MKRKYKWFTFLILLVFIITILYSGLFNFTIAERKINDFAKVIISNNIKEYDAYFSENKNLKYGDKILSYAQARENVIHFIETNTVTIGSSGYTPYSEMYDTNHYNTINVNFLCDFDVPRKMEINTDIKCYFWGIAKVIKFESNSKNFEKIFFGDPKK